MRTSFFERDGLVLAARESGEGLPFVFQHGLCGDALQTDQVFPESVGYRRITVECRGHGHSDAGVFDKFSIETFAQDVEFYIDQNDIENPVIGGISMGAAIALRLAVLRPGKFKALVLARPAWLDEGAPDNLFPNAAAGHLLSLLPPLEAATAFEDSDLIETLKQEGPDNLNSIHNFFMREPRHVTANLLQRISEDGPGVSEADIRAITIPTLVIGNALDYVHPLAYARTLAEWIPGARFVEVTAKASDPARYQADFEAALAAFLKEL
jgi:pimeloyl-ACP methyl ester carboxylesterase